MDPFGVEIVFSPVINGDISIVYKVLDSIPGTILIEDHEQPVLMFTLHALSSTAAIRIALDCAMEHGLVVHAIQMMDEPDVEYDQNFDARDHFRKPKWWRPLPRQRWPAWVPGSTCRD